MSLSKATTSGGSGDVSKVGTPLDNQVGVWTGDGTIEGTSSLVFDGTNLGIGKVPTVELDVSGSALIVSLDADTAAVYGYSDVGSNAGTTYGLRGTNISIGTGTGYGVQAASSGANATNYGGYFNGTAATANNYGVRGDAAGVEATTGVWGRGGGSDTVKTWVRGVYGQIPSNVTTTVTTATGVYGSVDGNPVTGRGVYGEATGTGSTTNYGGYFTASGGTNNYGLVVESGNSGFGTLAPSYKLHCVGTAYSTSTAANTSAFYGYSAVGSAAGTTYAVRAENVSIGTGAGYGIRADSTGANTTNYGGYFASSGATNNYGAVFTAGAGTVRRAISTGGGDVLFDDNTGQGQFLFDADTGRIGIGTVAPTQKIHVVGNAIVTQILRIGDGSEASPAYQFVSDTNTGIWNPSSDTLAISTAATERWRIGSDGQVQLPIATPAESSGTVTIDFSESNLQSIDVDSGFSGASITLATLNLAAGRTVKLRINDTGASGITITEHSDWVTMGEAASVNAEGMAVVELTSWGGANTEVTAEWSVAPF